MRQKYRPVLLPNVPSPNFPSQSKSDYWALGAKDVVVFSPDQSAIIQGGYYVSQIDGIPIEWKEIKGPVGCVIESPSAYKTWISNLEPGEYEFQLNTKDTRTSLSLRDTIKVSVFSPPVNAIFSSTFIVQKFNWGSVYKADVKMLTNNPFKVYLNTPDRPTNWGEVKQLTIEPNYYDDWYYPMQPEGWLRNGELWILWGDKVHFRQELYIDNK